MRVLYIGGSGRSGSTLLARLLHAGSTWTSVGELRYVWDRGLDQSHLCECGCPFRECAFWTHVFDEAFGGFAAAEDMDVPSLARAVDRVRFIPALAAPRLRSGRFQQALDDYGQVLSRLYEGIGRVSGADGVIDSSKDPSYAYVLCAVPELTVSVVHVVRDSRAVAYSWTRTRRRPEIHWETAYMQRRPVSRSALRWSQDNLLFEGLARSRQGCVRVRYEDLVDAVEPTISVLAATVDDFRTRTAGGPERQSHSMSGNPMRFEAGPVAVTPDFRWQEEMPPRQRRAVACLTSPLLLTYGYLGPRRR